jgi:Mycobacterium membrane protein
MRTRLIATAALLVAASLTTAAAAGAEPGDTVTYNVDADGPLMLVSYHDDMDNIQQLTNQPAPWTTSFTSAATYGLFAVGAKTSGERVTCEIIVNGEVRDQKSSNGRHTLADCSAGPTILEPSAPPPVS